MFSSLCMSPKTLHTFFKSLHSSSKTLRMSARMLRISFKLLIRSPKMFYTLIREMFFTSLGKDVIFISLRVIVHQNICLM